MEAYVRYVARVQIDSGPLVSDLGKTPAVVTPMTPRRSRYLQKYRTAELSHSEDGDIRPPGMGNPPTIGNIAPMFTVWYRRGVLDDGILKICGLNGTNLPLDQNSRLRMLRFVFIILPAMDPPTSLDR